MTILDELQWRGLYADCTDLTTLTDRLGKCSLTLYCGFDPTADSLHVGHLVPLLALARFQRFGHHPIAVAGGATGSIGDPSGKSAERSLLTKDQIAANVAAVRPQLERFLDFTSATNPARLVDNADWTAGISYLDFLREVGKHFTVNVMVAKESVRARMEDREVGISYTEFSYMLLQAFDFYHLHKTFGCELQIGGSDQWGNITMGIDLTRKKGGGHAFGLTLPLITKANGTKFGKTEAGAIWLDPRKTSVYRFYQFWINADDRDVIRYLKYFTFLGREEIESRCPRGASRAGGGGDGFDSRRSSGPRGATRQPDSVWRRARRHPRKHLPGDCGGSAHAGTGRLAVGRRRHSAAGFAGGGRLVSEQGPGAKGCARRRHLFEQSARG
jgi:tyrosyl-tRNA synthetase